MFRIDSVRTATQAELDDEASSGSATTASSASSAAGQAGDSDSSSLNGSENGSINVSSFGHE